jgi:hypothetical protein
MLWYLNNQNKIRFNSRARFSHEHNCFANTDFIWISKALLENDTVGLMGVFDLKIRAPNVTDPFYRLHNDKYKKFQQSNNCVFRALMLKFAEVQNI